MCVKELTLILEKLDRIESRLEKLENGTNKMSRHIDFINDIYDNIKIPFHNLISMVKAPDRIKKYLVLNKI